jgi:hypothetical protein
MKILYKCRKNDWFVPLTDNEAEAYYLEVNEEENNGKLRFLLNNDNGKREEQLESYGKNYIIVDKYINFAIYVPHGGPHWPASGFWDGSDMFIGMYGLEIANLDCLVNIEKSILENSADYLKTDIGKFGNVNDFRFGKNGHEYFTSAIAVSLVYNYFIKQEKKPIIPDENMPYAFTVDGERILVKTNAFFNNEYNTLDWYDNSCWKKNDEINTNEWDTLYYVPIIWDNKKYNLFGIYKITYEQFHNNKALIDEINSDKAWYIPIDIEHHWWWIKKYKIKDTE